MTAATPSIVPPNHLALRDTAFPSLIFEIFFLKLRKKGRARRGIIRGIIHSRGCCLSRILIRLGELVAIDNWNFSSFNFGNFLPILLYLPIFVRIDRKLLLGSLNYLRFINIKEKRQRERERHLDILLIVVPDKTNKYATFRSLFSVSIVQNFRNVSV